MELAYGDGMLDDIGVPLEDAYCIDHWLRLDHLSIEVQLLFFWLRLNYCRTELVRCLEVPTDTPNSTTSRHPNVIKWRKMELAKASTQMRLFAERYSLAIPQELLDLAGEPKREQLSLFGNIAQP